MTIRPDIRLTALAALCCTLCCILTPQAAAPQNPPARQGKTQSAPVSLDRFRSKRSVVRSGRMPLPDSLRRDGEAESAAAKFDPALRDSLIRAVKERVDQLPDSLVAGETARLLDSLGLIGPDDSSRPGTDSLAGDSLRTRLPAGDDSLTLLLTGGDSLLRNLLPADSLLRTVADSPGTSRQDSLRTKERQGSWFMRDSMSLSRVCWMSLPLPGYGQIYNKQYWKLPVLYGTVGTSLALFFHENSKYKPLKRQYDELTSLDMTRTEELESVQAAMIRHNTRRQIYLFTAIGSYIYFIGDAAVNYATNDVSSVKKATTLATICPAAGQIYNQSYWKVPIVLGGFASMIYVIDWNNRGYQRFKKAYRLRYEYDQKLQAHQQDPENNPKPEGSTDEFRGRYSAEFLKNLKNNYRRNRDLSIIATAGIYLLQIVDAHVDAHLKDFDISDDLSMRVTPTFDSAYIAGTGTRPVVGFNFMVNF